MKPPRIGVGRPHINIANNNRPPKNKNPTIDLISKTITLEIKNETLEIKNETLDVNENIQKLKTNLESVFTNNDKTERINLIKELNGTHISFLLDKKIITSAEANLLRFAKTIGTTDNAHNDNVMVAAQFLQIYRDTKITVIDLTSFKYLETLPEGTFNGIEQDPGRIKEIKFPPNVIVQMKSKALEGLKNNALTLDFTNNNGCILTNDWNCEKIQEVYDFHIEQLIKLGANSLKSTDVNKSTTITKNDYKEVLEQYAYFDLAGFDRLSLTCTLSELIDSLKTPYIPEILSLGSTYESSLIDINGLPDDNTGKSLIERRGVLQTNPKRIYDPASVANFTMLKAKLNNAITVTLAPAVAQTRACDTAESVRVAQEKIENELKVKGLTDAVNAANTLLARANEALGDNPVIQEQLKKAHDAVTEAKTVVESLGDSSLVDGTTALSNAAAVLGKLTSAQELLKAIHVTTGALNDVVLIINVNAETSTLITLTDRNSRLMNTIDDLVKAVNAANTGNELLLDNTQVKKEATAALDNAPERQKEIQAAIVGINNAKAALSVTKISGNQSIDSLAPEYKVLFGDKIRALEFTIKHPAFGGLTENTTTVTLEKLNIAKANINKITQVLNTAVTTAQELNAEILSLKHIMGLATEHITRENKIIGGDNTTEEYQESVSESLARLEEQIDAATEVLNDDSTLDNVKQNQKLLTDLLFSDIKTATQFAVDWMTTSKKYRSREKLKSYIYDALTWDRGVIIKLLESRILTLETLLPENSNNTDLNNAVKELESIQIITLDVEREDELSGISDVRFNR
jgi:hypothetical protein